MMDGNLITIEGIDGCGKSSVIHGTGKHNGLKQKLPDDRLYYTKEPNENHWLGQQLRKALSGEQTIDDMPLLFLFLAEHSQNLNSFIKPQLQNGKTVVCDRYDSSRYAYQAQQIDSEIDSNTIEWLEHIQNQEWSVKPELTIIIDIPVRTSLERIDDDRETMEKKEILESARKTYLDLAAKNDHCVLVDGEMPIPDVVDMCVNYISEVLER